MELAQLQIGIPGDSRQAEGGSAQDACSLAGKGQIIDLAYRAVFRDAFRSDVEAFLSAS